MEVWEKVKNDIVWPDIDGIAVTAGNSEGKTETLKNLAEIFRDQGSQVLYIPEYIKDLDTDIENDSGLVSTGEGKTLKKLEHILEERLSSEKNDDLKGTISYLLKEEREHEKNLIFDFFKDKLKFQLFFKDGIEIKRSGKVKPEKLTSTGYKLMIRITAELYFYLEKIDKDRTTYIFVDEIDDKLDWKNRNLFFKELFIFLKKNFPNIKFIFSTNMPESIYTLPQKIERKEVKFKIIKIFQDENTIMKSESYDASDFLTTHSIDKIIFGKIDSFIEKSDNYKELEDCYKKCLSCSNSSCTSNSYPRILCNNNNYYYSDFYQKIFRGQLTVKEKILYDAITELRKK